MPLVFPIAFAFLVISSLVVVEFAPRRPLHYSFAFGGFALFLGAGPRAALVVLAAALVGAGIRRLSRRPAVALLVAGAGVAVGILAGHAVALALGVGYPLALGQARSLGDYMAVLCAAYVTFIVVQEIARRSFFAGGGRDFSGRPL